MEPLEWSCAASEAPFSLPSELVYKPQERPLSESVIFNRHNVIVTTTRLELPGQMYSMAQVTSVRAERADQHVLAGIMMIVGAA